jgi:WW domain-binding protein 4
MQVKQFYAIVASRVSSFIRSFVFLVQSVQFHERGEGHKAQVARRLTELTRKGEIEYRQQQQVNTDLQRMEEAALRAYHKDLTSNPDLSARVGFHSVHE